MKAITLLGCCICIVLCIPSLQAQNLLDNHNNPPTILAPNAFYIESFGNGVGVTLNYERRLDENFSLRCGIGTAYATSVEYGNPYTVATSTGNVFTGYGSETFFNNFLISFVALGNYWINIGSSHIKIGAGTALFSQGIDGTSLSGRIWSYDNSPRVWMTFSAAYQYQPREGGTLFEAAFTPLWSTPLAGDANRFIPYGGIGVGYSF
jgi:hypothetical protein